MKLNNKIIYILLLFSISINLILIFKVILQCDKKNESIIERNFYVETSRANDNVNKLIKKIYSDSELEKINLLKLSYLELDNLYPIECVRYINNIEYSVTYKSENKYLIIKFNKNGEKKYSNIYISSYEKSDFSFINIGESFFNIKEFDDNGYYYFWNSGNTETEYKSWHYTTDGYIIILTYDEHLDVIGIEEELI